MKNLISFWIIVTIIFANACTKSGIENDAMNSNKIKLSSTQVEVDFEGKIECYNEAGEKLCRRSCKRRQ